MSICLKQSEQWANNENKELQISSYSPACRPPIFCIKVGAYFSPELETKEVIPPRTKAEKCLYGYSYSGDIKACTSPQNGDRQNDAWWVEYQEKCCSYAGTLTQTKLYFQDNFSSAGRPPQV